MVHSSGRFKINKRGFWESSSGIGHWCDKNLALHMVDFFKKQNAKTVVDFGCGMAFYARVLRSNDFECLAFDGNPNTEILTNGLGKVLDLSQPIDLGRKLDWVLSLEVGGHIPNEFEQIFMDNLCHHANYGIILSWEIPSMKTTGDGHYNCRENEYVITEIEKRGFIFNKEDSDIFRSICGLETGLILPGYYNHDGKFISDKTDGYREIDWAPKKFAGWFKNTLLVFHRK